MNRTTKRLSKIKKKLNDQYYTKTERLSDQYKTVNYNTYFDKGVLVSLRSEIYDVGFGLALKHTKNRYNEFYTVLVGSHIRILKDNQIKKFWIWYARGTWS